MVALEQFATRRATLIRQPRIGGLDWWLGDLNHGFCIGKMDPPPPNLENHQGKRTSQSGAEFTNWLFRPILQHLMDNPGQTMIAALACLVRQGERTKRRRTGPVGGSFLGDKREAGRTPVLGASRSLSQARLTSLQTSM